MTVATALSLQRDIPANGGDQSRLAHGSHMLDIPREIAEKQTPKQVTLPSLIGNMQSQSALNHEVTSRSSNSVVKNAKEEVASEKYIVVDPYQNASFGLKEAARPFISQRLNTAASNPPRGSQEEPNRVLETA